MKEIVLSIMNKNVMRILFNCSTNVVGGGVQNAYNFIKYALEDNEIEWLFLVSSNVYKLLEKSEIFDCRIITIKESPSRNSQSRKKIVEYENSFKPDVVYTMAGPAYVSFNNYHIMGISNAYITHAKLKNYFHRRGLFTSIETLLYFVYHSFYARSADSFFFQTKSSRDSFCKRFHVDKRKTAIIPNTIGDMFVNREISNTQKDGILNIFCPAAAYPHKNLQIIPQIAQKLESQINNKKLKFTLTIPEESKLWIKIKKEASRRGVLNLIDNIGPFNYQEAAKLHNNADIIFIPSVLETFSTSYLEGMASKKPLLVCDLPFASEICRENAIYFKPFSTKDATHKIKEVINNYDHYSSLFANMECSFDIYGNQSDRYNLIKKNLLSIFERSL